MQRSFSRLSIKKTRQKRLRSHGILPNRTAHLRLVVLGASGVGKTCIISRFLYDRCPSEYTATVEELHRAEYELSGTKLTLDILDTSGTFPFPAMRRLSISTGDAFILVYSVQDESSFDEVKALRQQIIDEKGEDSPIVVVGNKEDIRKERTVSKEVAESTVTIEWGHSYIEASASTDANIVDIFNQLLQQTDVYSSVGLYTEMMKRRKSCPNPFPDEIQQQSNKTRNNGRSCVIM